MPQGNGERVGADLPDAAVGAGADRAIDASAKTIDLAVDAGYPAEYLRRPTTGYVFAADTRHWKPGTHNDGISGADLLDGRVVRLRLDGRPGGAIAVGDRMALRGPRGTDVLLGGCAGCRFVGVMIGNGSGPST